MYLLLGVSPHIPFLLTKLIDESSVRDNRSYNQSPASKVKPMHTWNLRLETIHSSCQCRDQAKHNSLELNTLPLSNVNTLTFQYFLAVLFLLRPVNTETEVGSWTT